MHKHIITGIALTLLTTFSFAKSLQLYDVEKEALENNLNILMAMDETASATALYDASVSAWLPQISVSLGATTTGREVGATKPHHYFTNGIALNQSVFSSDILFGIERSKIALLSTENAKEYVKNYVLLLAREGFLKANLYHQERLNYRNQVELYSKIVKQEVEKFDVGESTTYDLQQQRVSLAESLAKLEDVEKQYLNQLQTLRIALSSEDPIELKFPEKDLNLNHLLKELDLLHLAGSDLFRNDFEEVKLMINRGVQSSSKRLQPLFSEKEVQAWTEKALKHQPILELQKRHIEEADVAVKSAQGGYLPTLDLNLAYASAGASPTVADPLSKQVFPKKYYASAQLSLNWDVFNSFQTTQVISSKKHLRSVAKRQMENSTIELKVAVQNQLQVIESAIYNYITSLESVRLAELGVEQAFIEKNIGSITGLELRSAIQKLSDIVTIKNEANYELLFGYFKLLELVGENKLSSETGWVNVF